MRFHTLDQWLAWQEGLHPSAIELGLARVRRVFDAMARPGAMPLIISVAGTNGKGSTVAMLAAIYQAAGYRVGRYTSPHILRYNERIVVQGEPVNDERICAAFEAVDQARGEQSLTYFEFGTLAALSIFFESDLDVMVLEVGMGGRLDAVNIVDPDVAMVTAIDLDHREWLGDTREQIALEKAGIFRPGRPGIVVDPDIPASIDPYAEAHDIPLYRLHREFDYKIQNGQWQWLAANAARYALPRPAMAGEVQVQNAAGVIMALELLRERLPVSQAHIRQGLLSARLPGRYDYFPAEIATILDVAHNPSAAAALSDTLARHARSGRTLAVVGMMADKDHRAVFDVLAPRMDAWFIGPLQSPRSADANALGALAAAISDRPVRIGQSIADCYRAAQAQARAGDRIVVFGSFYTVAEIQAMGL